MKKRVVVAVTGASGTVLALRLLEELRKADVSTELICSAWGEKTLEWETGHTLEDLKDLADRWYDNSDMAASVSSGSYPVDAVVVVPCSMKTVAAAACGYTDTLIARVCDVAIKERRRLVLVPREAPLSVIHLENLLKLARAGAMILPPMPAFYTRPQSLEQLIDETVGRILDHMGISTDLMTRWAGDNETNNQ